MRMKGVTEYKIIVRTLQNNILTFTVSHYEVTPEGFVKFKDEKTGVIKIFHASNCEINEVQR